MQELKPGQVLAGRLVLSERCSDADHAESWRAVDQKSGDQALVKRLAAVAGDKRAVEARLQALAELNHPALSCAVEWLWFDGFQLQIRPWITADTSASLEPGNLDLVFGIAIRVAEGLHHAHQQGIYHGNLKPANVLIDSRGSPHLVDVGLGPAGTRGPAVDNDFASPESKAGCAADAGTDVYSAGALIYRWLSGRDPGRPLPESQRHADLIKSTTGHEPLPGLLVSLVVDSLSADPERRPATMLEVKERLEDARLAMLRARETGIPDAELSWQPGAGTPRTKIPTEHPHPDRKMAPARLLLGVALGVVAILLLSVLILLPRQIEQEREARQNAARLVAEQQARQQARAAARTAPEKTARVLTPEDLERLLAARQAAEETLDEIINLQIGLKEKQVERWALDQFEAVASLARSGDDPFRNQAFDAAGSIYQQALLALRQIDAQGQFVFAEALERGLTALDAGISAAAADAFGLAVALNAESDLARKGQQRATTLDQVWALLGQARDLDRAAAWKQAQVIYQRIKALDPETAGVDAAIRRIANTLAGIAFRTAMSSGLAALDQAQWNTARAAFGKARKMRPKARGPADGLLEVERRFRESEIQYHRIEALARQNAEQWADAVRHFDAVLSHDVNLRFAQEGKVLASDRLDLDTRLQQYVRRPERWWTERGRQEAASLLYDARSVETGGPRLASQIDQLAQLLILAERPVRVRLVSDSTCEVVVYKIGRLGTFDSREVKLRPGRYTAVGTRNGYRDVRREFMVHTDRATQPVVLRCDEKV